MKTIDQITPEVILARAQGKPSALQGMHSILCRLGFPDAAAVLSNEADLQLQHLVDVASRMYGPEAKEEICSLLLQAAATASGIAYAKGRADQRAADMQLIAGASWPADQGVRHG